MSDHQKDEERLKKLEKAIFGDDEEKGMAEKVDEMYELLTKGNTIRDFFTITFKLLIGIGILSGGLISLNTLWHKL